MFLVITLRSDLSVAAVTVPTPSTVTRGRQVPSQGTAAAPPAATEGATEEITEETTEVMEAGTEEDTDTEVVTEAEGGAAAGADPEVADNINEYFTHSLLLAAEDPLIVVAF